MRSDSSFLDRTLTSGDPFEKTDSLLHGFKRADVQQVSRRTPTAWYRYIAEVNFPWKSDRGFAPWQVVPGDGQGVGGGGP